MTKATKPFTMNTQAKQYQQTSGVLQTAMNYSCLEKQGWGIQH